MHFIKGILIKLALHLGLGFKTSSLSDEEFNKYVGAWIDRYDAWAKEGYNHLSDVCLSTSNVNRQLIITHLEKLDELIDNNFTGRLRGDLLIDLNQLYKWTTMYSVDFDSFKMIWTHYVFEHLDWKLEPTMIKKATRLLTPWQLSVLKEHYNRNRIDSNDLIYKYFKEFLECCNKQGILLPENEWESYLNASI